MQKLKHLLKKCRWFILAIALAFIGINIESRRIENAFHSQAYQSYVMMEYVPAQKRLTGKWPTDLSGLPTYVELERNQTQAYYVRERLAIVLEYHRKNYEKIDAIHKDAKSCTYILHLKGEDIDCKSKIDDRLK